MITYVSPDMRPRVGVRQREETVTRHERLTSNSTLCVADERIASDVVAGSHRYKLVARKVDAVELVRKKDLECIENRIDPTNPAEINRHLGNADNKACVYDQDKDQDTSSGHGLRSGLCHSCGCSENCGHDKRRHICND
jgi:hypothetical protein